MTIPQRLTNLARLNRTDQLAALRKALHDLKSAGSALDRDAVKLAAKRDKVMRDQQWVLSEIAARENR